jgi:hypothetical protein
LNLCIFYLYVEPSDMSNDSMITENTVSPLVDVMDTIESISTKHSILFRGNSLDAFIATYLMNSHFMGETKLYPISAHQTSTWPSKQDIAGSHVIMIDVNVPSNIHATWLKNGILSVNWIERYNSSYTTINYTDDMCVAQRVFMFTNQGLAVPAWIQAIDRIARWSKITHEDRCIREMLDEMVHMPVKGHIKQALENAYQIIQLLERGPTENPVLYAEFIQCGGHQLQIKDSALMKILSAGQIHVFTAEHVDKWGLSSNWLGANVFLLQNTNYVIDTNEAAHLTFIAYPGLHVFINYRKKIINGKMTYVYSARSQNFDLTADSGIFKGHPTAAGASIVEDDAMFAAPFTSL